ncbi:hypothetical protein MASR2M44_09420 [Bacteroidota bacterium]
MAQWDISNYPSDVHYFNQAIEFLDSNSVVVNDINGVYISKDRGKSFFKHSNRIFSGSILQFLSDTLLVNSASTDARLSGLSFSKDTGRTFIDFPLLSSNGDTFPDGEVFLYNFFSNGRAFVFDKYQNRYRLFRSVNHGSSWEELDTGRIVGPRLLGSLGWNHPVYKFDSTVLRLDRSGKFLMKATSFGDSIVIIPLSQLAPNSAQPIFHVAFKSEQEGLAIEPGTGNVYRTLDGGFSFQELTSPVVRLFRIDFVKDYSVSKGFYIAGAGSNFNGSFASFDNGSSWTSIGDVFNYLSLRFHSVKFGISSSANNGERIRYFTGLPFNSIDKKMPGSIDLAIFPNPTATHFRIQGADMFSNVFVSIFNLQGKLLYSGEHSFQTDWVVPVNTLSSGVYVVSLQANHSGYPVFRRLVVE